MPATIIIPARYASSRLPGKPLLDRTGKPLIQHVVENVSRADDAGRVVVATDDERIVRAVEDFGGTAVLTREDHPSGTDRLAEAAVILQLAPEDIVINVQGDEPDIGPAVISRLYGLLSESGAPMATLCTPLSDREADNPNAVKVVMGKENTALYFSRSKIPYDREQTGVEYRLHLGIYAYRNWFLQTVASLPPTPLEQAEKLEQLRVLENGYAIAVCTVEYQGIGIDTPEDYEAFVTRYRP